MALIVDIEKKIGSFHLKSTFESGNETLALLGASGCGKSMTLKCIAGIQTPDKGEIVLNGKVLFCSKKKINLPARKRSTGYLFQDYALFPNMTVAQNIACGIPKGQNVQSITDEKIADFYLSGHENQYPFELSGGQQQRVALARMLASDPALLMLDEPFTALDSALKWQMEQEIMKVQERFSGTILFVSHNRDEVYRLCNRVAVMQDGHTQDVLNKKELYENPRTLSAALLSGCKNISGAKKTGAHTLFAQDWNVSLCSTRPVPDGLQYVGYRAHCFKVVSDSGSVNTIECDVTRVIEDMFSIIVMAHINGGLSSDRAYVRFETSKENWAALGVPKKLYLEMNPSELILMR